MLLNWIDRIGDWNPQFYREVKGRFTSRNLSIVSLLSATTQVIIWFVYESALPLATGTTDHIYNRYCTGQDSTYSYSPLCVLGDGGHFLIKWPQFWLDLYVGMGIVGLFILMVAGTYLIMNDLSQEERRGTLNFLRLSPRTSLEILLGKMLGVPSLLYTFVLLALPFHLWAGIHAQINPGLLLCFNLVSLAAGICCLSAVVLVSFYSQWLGGFGATGGFQPWAGALGVLGLVSIALGISNIPVTNTAFDFLYLCSPFNVLASIGSRNLENPFFQGYALEQIQRWQWFNLSIGKSVLSLTLLTLVNYGIAIYWLWEGLKRCFRNPHLTVWSKRQSYWMTGCLEVLWLGFAIQNESSWGQANKWNDALFGNLGILLGWNLLWFGLLIFALAPQRQTLQDWARYHSRHLMKELIWGEKSPSLAAIAINLLLACCLIGLWSLSVNATVGEHLKSLASLLSFATLILIYAGVVQCFLFLKTPWRGGLALAALSLFIITPYCILGFFTASPQEYSQLWLFTPITTVSWGYGNLRFLDALFPLGAQWLILGLLTTQLSHQLKLAGASTTKVLLTPEK